ncbi:hypothetical protein CBR_g13006 [Chara braunii]|uniref:RNA-directed DNA polymerase n=1 Tax=Chara braunii TaxID=69332 RepID=A0A388KTA2_CHABU|nr:hypothetical protein CBR_g13006 [Chara braunii]|eukprot:GBG73287.1 hypothetical protein CBR_g13006 [Chara braunii]
MATGEGAESQQDDENLGVDEDVEREEDALGDRESAKSPGAREGSKEIVPSGSSGKDGGSKRGIQETKEVRDKGSPTRQHLEGAEHKKVRLTDTRKRLVEIERRTTKFRPKLLEEIMNKSERNSADGRIREEEEASQGKGGQDADTQQRKDRAKDPRGTPTRKKKEKADSPGRDVERPTNPPLLDSGASRPSASLAIARGCEGLWSLRERVLGWFDPEGTARTRGRPDTSKEDLGAGSAAGSGMVEGGLRKVVSSLTRASSKNQGYLADAKKKLTFDEANITKFLIDYENLAALLRWSEEEKMEHLGQHVSLNLGRDIMAIVATTGSWKEARDVVMRKYLAAEKMATEAELGAVQRKDFATYNDFLREFAPVALRIPGVTDRIMSKYFLRQFTKFDKDKILSAYEQTTKFLITRDVDFITITDIAEKMVVNNSLALLKEGEVIDLTARRVISPRLPKGLRHLLTRQRVEVEEESGHREEEKQEEASQEVANFQRVPDDLEDLEKAFANIRLSLPDREGGEVMRAPPGTKLSFHALRVGKLRVQIGCHHTDALVDGGAEITLIRKDFVTIAGCPINRETTGSVRGAGEEIPFSGYVTKCTVKAGVREESIWSFQRMPVMDEMDHDIILGRPWCANVEMIGMHLHDGACMVDIEDPVTGCGELLRLIGTRGDTPKGKLATWSPSFEESARKGAFTRMEGMRERVEIMIEEAFRKKEWVKMGLPQKKRRPDEDAVGVMVVEKETKVELGASLPKREEARGKGTRITPEIPDLFHLIKAIRYHKVGVDTASLARCEEKVWKGYCLNGELVSIQPRIAEVAQATPAVHFFRRKIREGSVRKYKPVGKKAKPVSILLEMTKEEAMEKEEEVLRVIKERRAAEGHRIPDEVAQTMKIGEEGFPTEQETRVIKEACQEFLLAFVFNDHQKGRLDAKLIPPVRIHIVEHECWNDKGPAYDFGIAGEVMPMGFINTVAEAQRRMLVIAGDMFPARCEPYIDDNPVKGVREKDETEVQSGVRKFVWDHLQDIKELLRRFPAYNITASGPKSILAVPEVTILGFRCEDGRERPIRFESRTLNSAERRYSQFKEVLAILHCLKTFQAYLFGRRFILRIDPTNVAGALKNYRPIDPTVGRWVGLIWQFDYEIERIVGVRNRANGLSRVSLTPEGLEEAEPIDAFLDHEGGTLVVDNEMAGTACMTGELFIKVLEKGPSTVVAELREGVVTKVGRKEEKDAWGSIVGPREERMALAIEGGWRRVMNVVESWEQEKQQYAVSQMCDAQPGSRQEEEFFFIKSYDGIFREIGLLLVGNKDGHEVSPKAREEADKYVLRRGHLFRKEEGLTPRRVVCGKTRQVDIIQAMHDGLAGGHRSSKGAEYDAGVWPLRPTRVLGPGHMVHLDLAVMPVLTKGYKYILDARDNLSGFVEAMAIKKKTGLAVADWVEDFYLRHPFIRRFIADNGTEFVNQDVLNTCKRLGVPLKLIEPYHLEANAPVDRGHQTLKNTIAKLAADDLGN